MTGIVADTASGAGQESGNTGAQIHPDHVKHSGLEPLKVFKDDGNTAADTTHSEYAAHGDPKLAPQNHIGGWGDPSQSRKPGM